MDRKAVKATRRIEYRTKYDRARGVRRAASASVAAFQFVLMIAFVLCCGLAIAGDQPPNEGEYGAPVWNRVYVARVQEAHDSNETSGVNRSDRQVTQSGTAGNDKSKDESSRQVADPKGEAAGDLIEPMPSPSDLNALEAMIPTPARGIDGTRRPALGAVAGSVSAAPSMIGDFFGGTFLRVPITFESGPPPVPVVNSVASAGGDRRFKVAENVSPIPRDRIFFNYNHFQNALLDVNQVSRNLDRFTFGFEKTFFDGDVSVETRLPFAYALDSRQRIGVSDSQNTELGNLAFGFKASLLATDHWLLSAGTTLTVPTGDDYELYDGSRRELRIENGATHLAPFLGFVAVPKRNCFAQLFLQTDFDLNGNEVSTWDNGYEGILQDQNLLFFDVSVGRWLRSYRNGLGVAAMAELHYTTTLNDADQVAGITNPSNRMDILNATGALNFRFGHSTLRVGAAAPLRDDEERLFDAEFILQLNVRTR